MRLRFHVLGWLVSLLFFVGLAGVCLLILIVCWVVWCGLLWGCWFCWLLLFGFGLMISLLFVLVYC